jgi:hypothetical protein
MLGDRTISPLIEIETMPKTHVLSIRLDEDARAILTDHARAIGLTPHATARVLLQAQLRGTDAVTLHLLERRLQKSVETILQRILILQGIVAQKPESQIQQIVSETVTRLTQKLETEIAGEE